MGYRLWNGTPLTGKYGEPHKTDRRTGNWYSKTANTLIKELRCSLIIWTPNLVIWNYWFFRYLELVMSSLSCFNASFIKADCATCDEQDHGVDLKTARECFEIISKIEHPSILDTVSKNSDVKKPKRWLIGKLFALRVSVARNLIGLVWFVITDFDLRINNGVQFATYNRGCGISASIRRSSVVSSIFEFEKLGNPSNTVWTKRATVLLQYR